MASHPTKIRNRLAMAIGILLISPALHATTLQFSGYVSRIDKVIYDTNAINTGMAISGTLTYDSAAAPFSSHQFTSSEAASYLTGRLDVTIGTIHISTPIEDQYMRVGNGFGAHTSDQVKFSQYDFESNIKIPAAGTNPLFRSNYIELLFNDPTHAALSSTSIPTVSALSNPLFAKTLRFSIDGSVYGVPCAGNSDDLSCAALEYYQVTSTITSVSEVPLPPAAVLSASALALLFAGKKRRKLA
jgi:hypothetical protein